MSKCDDFDYLNRFIDTNNRHIDVNSLILCSTLNQLKKLFGIQIIWRINWNWRCHTQILIITSQFGLALQLPKILTNICGHHRHQQFLKHYQIVIIIYYSYIDRPIYFFNAFFSIFGRRYDGETACAPDYAFPSLSNNSFEVINNRLEERVVTVRWSHMGPFEQCYRLNEASPQSDVDKNYEIILLDIQGNKLYRLSHKTVINSLYFFFIICLLCY